MSDLKAEGIKTIDPLADYKGAVEQMYELHRDRIAATKPVTSPQERSLTMSVKCFKHAVIDCDRCEGTAVSGSLTMSEVKHTPGPWKWVLVKHEGAIDCHTLEGPMVLCRFWGGERNVDADAELIASAPDLAADRDALRAQLTAALVERDEARNFNSKNKQLADSMTDTCRAMEAPLLAAQVEIGGLRSAIRIVLDDRMTDASLLDVLEQALKPTVNASAGERVRGVIEAAKKHIETPGTDRDGQLRTADDLVKALAALKEVQP